MLTNIFPRHIFTGDPETEEACANCRKSGGGGDEGGRAEGVVDGEQRVVCGKKEEGVGGRKTKVMR